MSNSIEDLTLRVLELPPEDRAKLVERLLASFEPKSSAQIAWLKLAESRRDEVRSGKVALVPGDEALARIRSRLS